MKIDFLLTIVGAFFGLFGFIDCCLRLKDWMFPFRFKYSFSYHCPQNSPPHITLRILSKGKFTISNYLLRLRGIHKKTSERITLYFDDKVERLEQFQYHDLNLIPAPLMGDGWLTYIRNFSDYKWTLQIVKDKSEDYILYENSYIGIKMAEGLHFYHIDNMEIRNVFVRIQLFYGNLRALREIIYVKQANKRFW